MKRIIFLQLLCAIAVVANAIDVNEIRIRDPFVYADPTDNTYYLYRASSTPEGFGGVEVLTSKDLKTWTDPVNVLALPADNWLTGPIWAPEMHKVGDKYYIFATVNGDVIWKREHEGRKYEMRGTQIFVADSPKGPFKAFDDRLPATPMGQMCLDGTYFHDRGKHYMIFCHEWVELRDGTIEAVELTPDLQHTVGNPIRLFCGSAPEWSTGRTDDGMGRYYVTDGNFLYRSPKSGKLFMIWSSFINDDYALGVAESLTGHVTGPWKQIDTPLVKSNSGHGMIFKDFSGNLWIALHGPNSPSGAERLKLLPLVDDGYSLKLKQAH